MGKTVLKTVLYSILCFIFLFVIVICLWCVISPLSMAKITSKLNLDKFTTYLTVNGYERSEDINDLGDLVERSIISESYDVTAKYSKQLMEHKDYAGFVQFKNEQFASENNAPLKFTYDNFVEANYVYASFKSDGDSEALMNVAITYIAKRPNEYLINNAMSAYIRAGVEENALNLPDSVIKVLFSHYENLRSIYERDDDHVTKSYLRSVSYDIYTVYKTFTSDSVKTEEWKEIYNQYI